MVEVDDNEPVAPVRDETALDIFRHQWELYRKFLEARLSVKCRRLRRAAPLPDARRRAPLRLYRSGVRGRERHHPGAWRHADRALSRRRPRPAGARARAQESGSTACDVDLEKADFAAAMHKRREPADIVWISLSLHHLATPDKAAFMRDVRRSHRGDGALLIYEPTSYDGESRPAWLGRFEQLGRREWTALSADEFEEAMEARAHLRFAGDGFRLDRIGTRRRICVSWRALLRAGRSFPDV